MRPVGHGGGSVLLWADCAQAAGEAVAEGEVGLRGALSVGVVAQAAGVEGVPDAAAGGGVVVEQCLGDVFGVAHDEDFAAGFEAVGDARPVVAEQAGAGAGDLEDARGGREAEVGHGRAVDVQHHAGGAVDSVVPVGGDMADVADVGGHALVAPAFAAEQEALVGGEFGRAQEELLDAGLAVGQAIAEEGHVAGQLGVGLDGVVGFGVEPVVHRVVGACAEAEEAVARLGATAVGQHGVVGGAGLAQGVVGIGAHAVDGGGGVDVPDEAHDVFRAARDEFF